MASDSLIKLQDSLWEILATLDSKECSVRELYGLVIRALRDSATAPDPPKLPTSPPIVLNPKAEKAKPYRNQDGVPVHEEMKEAIKEKVARGPRKKAAAPEPLPEAPKDALMNKISKRMSKKMINAPGTKTENELETVFQTDFIEFTDTRIKEIVKQKEAGTFVPAKRGKKHPQFGGVDQSNVNFEDLGGPTLVIKKPEEEVQMIVA